MKKQHFIMFFNLVDTYLFLVTIEEREMAIKHCLLVSENNI